MCMKKDRNCGASYLIYPAYQPGGYGPNMMTNMNQNYKTNNVEQQINSLEQRVTILEKKVSTLVNLYNNNSY